MKLDVGCGDKPTGDVNLDVYVGKSPHFQRPNRTINPSAIPNFVRGSCHFLPFRDNVFEETFCSHLLEHKDVNFRRSVLEMVRVSNTSVRFVVPHRYSRQWCMHTSFFNETNLRAVLVKMKLAYTIKVEYRGFPSKYLGIIKIPFELHVSIPCDKLRKQTKERE